MQSDTTLLETNELETRSLGTDLKIMSSGKLHTTAADSLAFHQKIILCIDNEMKTILRANISPKRKQKKIHQLGVLRKAHNDFCLFKKNQLLFIKT